MLKQRLIYGYPLGAVIITILAYGNTLLFFTVLIFSIFLLIEFYQITGLRSDRRLFPMRRWGYILAIIILTLVFLNLNMYLDFAIVTFIIAALIYRMANFNRKTDNFLRDLSITILGGIYIGGFLSYLLRLSALGEALKVAEIIPMGSGWLSTIPLLGGVLQDAGWTSGLGQALAMGPNWLVILPILGSWGYDFSAFFTGMRLGKTPLAPSISPKKTIEGMVGGVIGCGTSVVILSVLIGISAQYFLFLFILGMFMGTFSQLGDLCVSSIKRDAGIKDSARLIPGHGGLLDKCDGLLFVLPVCYYSIYFMMLIAGIPAN